MGLSEKVQELVQKWLEEDSTEYTRAEIEELVKEGNEKELQARLGKRIEFGTAGLRGPMRAGYSMMNNLTVQQATQGLVEYLLGQEEGATAKEKGVVVGYDHRFHSQEFARWTAATFVHRGVPVYLYREVVPTPFVPFGLLELGCVCGVMITASHNPKDDNGYKLYWSNGAQIIEPRDRDIAQSIANHSKPWLHASQLDALLQKAEADGLIKDPLPTCAPAYYERIQKNVMVLGPQGNAKAGAPTVVYTAMHGVGAKWVTMAFEAFGLNPYVPVVEQVQPDPNFPTVAFPNPEEGKGALKLAMQTADAAKARVILANDPDADRLAVAEQQPDGAWKILTGNEIGALLAWWVFSNYRTWHPSLDKSSILMANSTVSSKFLAAMAHKEGFRYEETLTGFKWLGNVGDRLRATEGLTFLFAFEEAIGFMVGDACLDKDGVRSAAAFAEMLGHLYRNGSSCQKQLDALYATYGYFESANSYFFCYDLPVMDRVLAELRGVPADTPAWEAQGRRYPKTCGRFAIASVCDPQFGFDSAQADGVCKLPRASRMLTFRFENGAVATLRGSGTEPKFKRYIEMRGSDPTLVHSELTELSHAIVNLWLRPEANGLIPPSSD